MSYANGFADGGSGGLFETAAPLVDVQEISPAEVERRFPLCRVDDVLAGFYVPTDGRVNPVDATAALARAARRCSGTPTSASCTWPSWTAASRPRRPC